MGTADAQDSKRIYHGDTETRRHGDALDSCNIPRLRLPGVQLRIGLHPPRRLVAQDLGDFGFAFERLDLAIHDRGVLDIEPAAFVDRVAAEHAAVDHLRAALDGEAADTASEDVQASAVFDDDVAIDRPAHVELAAL